MDELLRYISITEEIRRLEAEREAIRARAIQHVKNAGGEVEDGEVRVTYVAKPIYRFTGAVTNMREQMAKRQRREIERGIAVREHQVEILHIDQQDDAEEG